MKVVCVTHDYNGPWSSFNVEKYIKIGELYDVIENFDDERGNYYQITTRYGLANLSKHYFKAVSQLRQEKLNELGI